MMITIFFGGNNLLIPFSESLAMIRYRPGAKFPTLIEKKFPVFVNFSSIVCPKLLRTVIFYPGNVLR